MISIEGITELNSTNSLLDLDNQYNSMLNQLDLNHYTYTFYDYAAKVKHQTCPTALKKWHEHFQHSQYESIDPIGHEVRNRVVPLPWDLHQSWKMARGTVKKMFQEALDHGLTQGISIPIHGPHGFEAIQTIQGPEIIARFTKETDSLCLIHHLALNYHQRVRELQSDNDAQVNFTKRELECLRLTEQQMTANDIATVLCISPRTVVFHLENINRKLNTTNKYYAVLAAKKLRVI